MGFCQKSKPFTMLKVSKYGVISGPYFPVFGLNTEIYGVINVSSLNMKMMHRNFLHDSAKTAFLGKI